MRLYVGYFNYGYEGCSEPKIAFTDAAQSSAWLEGTRTNGGTEGKIAVLEIPEQPRNEGGE